MAKKEELKVTYSVKELVEGLHDKIDTMKTVQEQTLKQATKTNGRVTTLEKRSIGLWVSLHPFQFTLYALILLAILISDVRHPLIQIITSLL